jgi:predicted RNase H-like nuclease (RuvC/YqgF family)
MGKRKKYKNSKAQKQVDEKPKSPVPEEKDVTPPQNSTTENKITPKEKDFSQEIDLHLVGMDKRVFDQILFENKVLKMENEDLKGQKNLLQNSLQNCQTLLVEKGQTTTKEIEQLQKENTLLKEENKKLLKEIGELKTKLENVEARLKTLEIDVHYKHKKALLGQLAFGTERLILEHIYGSPLDRSKCKLKLIDINEDN